MKPILLLFVFVLPFLVVVQRCDSISKNKVNEAQGKKLLQKKDKKVTVKKDNFFVPSVIRTDKRVAYLHNKKKFTDKIIQFLEDEKINSDIFIVLRDNNSVKAPENLNKYDLLFQKA